MKYNEQKREAVKLLFLEILELNEKFEQAKSEKEIQFELDGGEWPLIIVRFWNWNAENNPEETFEISLEDHDKFGRRHDFRALSEKVRDWRERFGNS